MNEITFEQFRVLNLAMDIMKRDDRRPNGDSWFDAISELEHQGTLTKEELSFLRQFNTMIDRAENAIPLTLNK
jgi:hypothetical protein